MDIVYYWSKLFKKIRFSSIKNSMIHKTSKIESGCNVVNVEMDRFSFCGYDCEIINSKIGSFCSIANNVIIGGAMHPIDWVSTSPVFYEGRDSVKIKFYEHKKEKGKTTFIGHDVWIGQYSLIKQGVSIGTGAVIGMGSIVTKDVPPYTVVAGCPAKIIRDRFDKKIKDSLLESNWWMLPNDKLKELGFYFNDPIIFLDKVKK